MSSRFFLEFNSLDCSEKLNLMSGLDDQEILTEIALYDKCRKVRSRAIMRLNDESILEEILLNEYEDKLCFRAFQRLQRLNPDSSLFYDMDYIFNLEDEDELIDIYKNSIYKPPLIIDGYPVNLNAMYYYLIYWDERWRVRWAIASNPNLKNKRILKDMILKDYHIKVRAAAMGNPNFYDEDLFCELALYSPKYTLRGVAASRLSNEGILKHLALNDEATFVRESATENPNLTDQEALVNIALNDRHYQIRKKACLKLEDKEVLRQVISKDYHSWVKKAAKERLRELGD